ncbi:MAG: hypothetical protein B7Z67_14015 [Acidiphilium sp. 21-60-14]|jgi:hypothetical protein|uniref:hypothetical protein n=1 Tax=Acidiphilium sp. C61 TaxID=1671485 RepID=UPI000BD89056|nr:hypothetical protein [Acidiphilium sp. C61]OYV68237.1 MAG: hypothetical protein B7Z67_14015 [Acidiphilium sp. 21-60-14]
MRKRKKQPAPRVTVKYVIDGVEHEAEIVHQCGPFCCLPFLIDERDDRLPWEPSDKATAQKSTPTLVATEE